MSPARRALDNPWKPHDPAVLQALAESEVGELRLVYHSSNYVFIAELTHPVHGNGVGVYKPGQGEQPLYDFPDGLYRREVAAYEFARLLGWELIPPTVERDGPQGTGSMQLFIEHDPDQHYFELVKRDELDWPLVQFAVFDLLVNNADRKGGHILQDPEGHLWGIDNGLCFHEYPKLRTVIWDFAGTEVPPEWRDDIRRVRDCISSRARETRPFTRLLDDGERRALIERCDALLASPVLPEMFTERRAVPWPLI